MELPSVIRAATILNNICLKNKKVGQTAHKMYSSYSGKKETNVLFYPGHKARNVGAGGQ